MIRAALVLPLLAPAAAAQVPTRDTAGAGIRGLVVTAAGGRPVDGAVVSVVEAQRAVTTGPSGTYQVLGVAAGTYTISVRKLGFQPIATRITLKANEVVDADMELGVAVQRLEGVSVRADSTRHGPMAQIENRMRYNPGGTYILRAELDSARGHPVSEVLGKRARGAHMVTWANRGAILLATSRGATSLTKLPRADPFDPTSPQACFCQVYVDGVRIYVPNGNEPAPDLSRYDVGMLEAMEYFAGPATTPLEYSGDGAMCGTLLLWTRAR